MRVSPLWNRRKTKFDVLSAVTIGWMRFHR